MVRPHHPDLGLIVAMDLGGLIGRDGGLPWRLSADLRRFKAITTGAPIIMGRKTHESIGRALPGRSNIVVTRNRDYRSEGCVIAHSLEQAIAAANQQGNIIGGASLYEAALPMVGVMHLTVVGALLGGDTFFPDFDRNADWRCVSEEHVPADEKNEHASTYFELRRA